jgi:hypothetical protein
LVGACATQPALSAAIAVTENSRKRGRTFPSYVTRVLGGSWAAAAWLNASDCPGGMLR